MEGGSRSELPVSSAFVAPCTYLKFLLESPFKYIGKARKYGAGSRIYILATVNIVSGNEYVSYHSWIIHILKVCAPRTNSLTETMNTTNG